MACGHARPMHRSRAVRRRRSAILARAGMAPHKGSIRPRPAACKKLGSKGAMFSTAIGPMSRRTGIAVHDYMYWGF